ncbi:MAG: FAD-dependent oxidoreductase [Bdellovibrionales bacterium]|nr:FAD-dependent oxidoreductase [Bdellovibrionales bacterium]
MRNNEIDIAVIGSGPAGAQAAAEAVYNGAKVTLFDIGHEDKIYEPLIPESSFSEIRKIDPKQSHYFLGENFKNISSKHEAGIHLSPGRMSAITEGKKIFSTECHNFHILQSSALGGLGAAWGANCFEYDAHELERMGLPGADVQAMYPIITREIGVSGPKNSDLSNFIGTFDGIQPSLPLDSNAQKIFSNYMKRKALLNTRGFNLGQSVLATLSKPLKDREANPLYDMDFYANFGESVYRPKQTVSELLLKENFTYSPYSICQRIESIEPNNVQLYFKNSLNRAQNITCRARRVILAAGAIGSAQILLSSLGENNARLPLLCNRNHWIASLNLKMLGAKAGDRRHSLSQLTAIQTHPLNPNENIVAHFYSYRSLLLYRLIQESPFLPRTSLYLARLVMFLMIMVNTKFKQ